MYTPDISFTKPGNNRCSLLEKYEQKFDKQIKQILHPICKSKTKALIFESNVSEFYDELQFNDNKIFYSYSSPIEMVCYLNSAEIIVVDATKRNKKMNFTQTDVYYGNNLFHKIMSLDFLEEKMFTIIGIDTRNQYKICIFNIENDSKIQLKYEFYFRNKLLNTHLMSSNDLYAIFTEGNKKDSAVKLIKYQIKCDKLRDLHSTKLDVSTSSQNYFKITSNLPADTIIIGFGNRIITFNGDGVFKLETYLNTETENSVINHIAYIKKFIFILYQSGTYFMLDLDLSILVENPLYKDTKNLRLDRCFTNKASSSVYITWLFGESQCALRKFSFESNEIKTESSPNLEHLYISDYVKRVKSCHRVSFQEREFSRIYFENLNTEDEGKLNRSETFFFALKKKLISFDRDLIVTNTQDQTTQIHTDLVFNGFLNEIPYTYIIEFAVEKIQMFDEMSTADLNEKLIKYTKILLERHGICLSKDVVVIDVKGNSLEFTFSQLQLAMAFNNKLDSFEHLIDIDLNFYEILNMRLKKVNKHPIVEEIKISLDTLDSSCDKLFPVTDDDSEEFVGGLIYKPPYNWQMLGLNLEYLALNNNNRMWMNEWATAYKSIFSNQSQNFTCSSVVCDTQDECSVINLNNGIRIQMALMCKVNPDVVKIPNKCLNYYSVPMGNTRTFGILLKYISD